MSASAVSPPETSACCFLKSVRNLCMHLTVCVKPLCVSELRVFVFGAEVLSAES